MRVGIDVDGCLYDFVTDYLDFITAFCGVDERDLRPVDHWNFYEDYGFDVEDFNEHLTDGASRGLIFNQRPPYFGAVVNLGRLRELGHTVHIITDRGRFGHEAIGRTAEWLHEHGIPFDSLSFSKDKTLLDIDLMVEDAPMNLEALSKAGIQTVRYRQPWNVGVDADWFIGGWYELPKVVAAAALEVAR
jgi:FMN phosphatase YigB (HAD superfamily)